MIDKRIKNGEFIAVFFSSPKCSVCGSLYPAIKNTFEKNFPLVSVEEIKIENHPDLRAEYSIFTAPVFIVFHESRELIRRAGIFSIAELSDSFERYYKLITN